MAGFFVKRSEDGNAVACIGINLNLNRKKPYEISWLRLDCGLHVATENPREEYECGNGEGCDWLDGRKGEVEFGWNAAELEREIAALIQVKLDQMLAYAAKKGNQVTKQEIPVCCDRPMIEVVSYTTSNNAYSKKQDTPVWWCADCHRQIKREVA